MSMALFSKSSNEGPQFRQAILKGCLCFGVAMSNVVTIGCAHAQGTLTFNNTPLWSQNDDLFDGLGPSAGTATVGETLIAPTGQDVMLDNFSFVAEGPANLEVQAFVFEWSGNMVGAGGGAVGNPVYLSPEFNFSPTGWVPLAANIGGEGVALAAGQHYVVGFTISSPLYYSASTGGVEFELVPRDIIPQGAYGGGGAVWMNNGNNFAALNSQTWSTDGDYGDVGFTANFTVVPEPSIPMLSAVGVAIWMGVAIARKRRPGRV
jgi:hypothetical protein